MKKYFLIIFFNSHPYMSHYVLKIIKSQKHLLNKKKEI